MAKSQQTFNKLEKEKKRLKKREDKRKKMLARKEAKANGEYQVNEFVYVDYNGNFTDTRCFLFLVSRCPHLALLSIQIPF